MAIREEHSLKKIFDRQMDIHAGYLVYFDDVCMNEFVEGYVTNVGISVGVSSASVTIIYAPQFKSIDTVDELGTYLDGEDGVQNGVSLRIFAENIFSKKYHIIFDGIIKSRNFSRSPQGLSLVFSATDYMYWLHRSVIPVTIPMGSQIWPGERIRWKGQGIFVDNLDSIATVTSGQLVQKTISEYWNDILKKSLVNNSTVYSDSNSVAAFDDAINRVSILGDINPVLFSRQIIDLVITANAVFADTAYIALNNVTSKLLMEFFQDIDGVIKVKPPFWNEPVLKNYIIDPLMIKSGSENTNWESFYTRVIAQGGKEEWEPSDSEAANAMFTPIGVYVGEYKKKSGGKWADYLNYGGYETWGGDGPMSFTGGASESQCWGALAAHISNRAVICGIMANIQAESSFNPSASGDGGHAHGLFQWQDLDASGRRWQAVTEMARVEYANNNPNIKPYELEAVELTSTSLYTIDFQIKYFLQDIGYLVQEAHFVTSDSGKGNYTGLFEELKNCPDTAEGAANAAEIICRKYEKPGDLDGESANRKNAAKKYYDSYGKSNNNPGSAWDETNLLKFSKVQDANLFVASTSFKVKDFNCKGGAGCNGANGCNCGCTTTYIAAPVVKILQKIQDYLYDNYHINIQINSGYRCDVHNECQGGSATSLHRSGAAVDFQFKSGSTGLTIGELYNRLEGERMRDSFKDGEWQIGELIYYKNQGFIHIGINPDNSYENGWIQS